MRIKDFFTVSKPVVNILRFSSMIENGHAANLALRFGGIAGLLGLDVYPAADIYPDSTNSVAGLITSVNKN